MSEPSLHASLLSLAGGNMDALDTIYKLTAKKVYAVALSVVRDKYDAEDVMQDTYAKLCDVATRYQHGQHPEAWVCTIARNMAYDLLRRRKNDISLDEVEYCVPAQSEDTEVRETYGELLKVMQACLSEDEREILLLHTVSGMKHLQIATVLKKPYATVRWIYANALGKVRRACGRNE